MNSRSCITAYRGFASSQSFLAKKSTGALRGYTTSNAPEQAERTKRLLEATANAGLSYESLASKIGVTNTYAAQLLVGQAKLTPTIAAKLRDAIPTIAEQDLQDMLSAVPTSYYDGRGMGKINY